MVLSIKRIQSDGRGEFVSESFENLLVKCKIKHEKSAPYSPHQNGNTEKAWRTLFEMAQCMISEAIFVDICSYVCSVHQK